MISLFVDMFALSYLHTPFPPFAAKRKVALGVHIPSILDLFMVLDRVVVLIGFLRSMRSKKRKAIKVAEDDREKLRHFVFTDVESWSFTKAGKGTKSDAKPSAKAEAKPSSNKK